MARRRGEGLGGNVSPAAVGRARLQCRGEREPPPATGIVRRRENVGANEGDRAGGWRRRRRAEGAEPPALRLHTHGGGVSSAARTRRRQWLPPAGIYSLAAWLRHPSSGPSRPTPLTSPHYQKGHADDWERAQAVPQKTAGMTWPRAREGGGASASTTSAAGRGGGVEMTDVLRLWVGRYTVWLCTRTTGAGGRGREQTGVAPAGRQLRYSINTVAAADALTVPPGTPTPAWPPATTTYTYCAGGSTPRNLRHLPPKPHSTAPPPMERLACPN